MYFLNGTPQFLIDLETEAISFERKIYVDGFL